MKAKLLVIRMDYLTRRRAVALLGELAETMPKGQKKLTALTTLRALRDARDAGDWEGVEIEERSQPLTAGDEPPEPPQAPEPDEPEQEAEPSQPGPVVHCAMCGERWPCPTPRGPAHYPAEPPLGKRGKRTHSVEPGPSSSHHPDDVPTVAPPARKPSWVRE